MSSSNPPLSITALLIVDDSSVQRAHAVQLCSDMGIPMIYEASSGLEALELLKLLVSPPDLILVDLEMPSMDGVQLIDRLSQLSVKIPLVVASSRELELIRAVQTMGRNLGMTVLAGLQKPLQMSHLREALALRTTDSVELSEARTTPEIHARSLADAIFAGEIDVHYQPKVDMCTGIVRGVEALARWKHVDLGNVAPDQFIALAEKSGLIHELTRSVLSQALAQAARWNSHGLKLSMAVNLSPKLLDSPNLVDEICELLDMHDLLPEQVILEITEGSVVDCKGKAFGVLTRLRLKGFGLSIDDYGTGFSSMQQLSRIPFTELKVDRSFVRGASTQKNLRVILQSALDMARQLGLVTVAEGIETVEDWQLVQDGGCSVGQGYFIAKPMPAHEVPVWIRKHQNRLPELRAGRPKRSQA